MSYEDRLRKLRSAAASYFSSYAIPASLFLAIAVGTLYLVSGRESAAGGSFPRAAGDFMQAQKAERLLADLSSRLSESPDDIEALAESGRLKFQLGPEKYVEAIADLEKARDLGLADVRTFYYLGVMYQAEGLYEFALKEYSRFLSNYPRDTEVRMLLAKLCYASGDFPCAVREFESLSSSRPEDPVSLENLALARWKNGQDYSAALQRLRALGGAGEFLADQAEGSIAYGKKDYSAAAPLLSRAAAGAPPGFEGKAGLLWLYADASYRNKQSEEAHAALKELLKLDPGHEEAKVVLAKIERAHRAEEKKSKKKK